MSSARRPQPNSELPAPYQGPRLFRRALAYKCGGEAACNAPGYGDANPSSQFAASDSTRWSFKSTVTTPTVARSF